MLELLWATPHPRLVGGLKVKVTLIPHRSGLLHSAKLSWMSVHPQSDPVR